MLLIAWNLFFVVAVGFFFSWKKKGGGFFFFFFFFFFFWGGGGFSFGLKRHSPRRWGLGQVQAFPWSAVGLANRAGWS